ncbi:MAG: DUF2157 domain-containing protein [Zoogloeaceae bacterium]|jgi:uncharacterized membrane protein|nr:DUF2157 domain-containing protein [Zoogloeaceae bacterium]
MNLHRIQLLLWAEQGQLDPARLPEALRLADAFPATDDWRRFADRLLLALAVLALSSGVIFFFAYNWERLGHFSRFALAEGALAVTLFGVWRLGLDRLSGQASLFAAALCLGALLALLGQTYQTGADVWELFAVWCVLILPWALLGRQALLWLFWLALLNVALLLYLSNADAIPRLFGPDFNWQTFFIVNLCALALWEGAGRRFAELNRRWALRLVALAVTSYVTYGAVIGVWTAWESPFINRNDGGDALLIWALWAAGFGYFYRYRARDFFMLTLIAASSLLLAASTLIRLLTEHWKQFDLFTASLMPGVLIIGIALGVGAGLWRIRKDMAVDAREKPRESAHEAARTLE